MFDVTTGEQEPIAFVEAKTRVTGEPLNRALQTPSLFPSHG